MPPPEPEAQSVPGQPPLQRVVVLIGLPGSGKSRWLAGQGVTPLSSDHLRELLADDVNQQNYQSDIFRALRYLLAVRLDMERPVSYIDATNLVREQREPFLEIVRERGCRAEAVFFDVPLDVCLARNSQRPRQVPEDVMKKMADLLEPPGFEEGFQRIVTIDEEGRTKSDEVRERAGPLSS